MSSPSATKRKVEDFSLHILRNFALILGVGLAVASQGEVLARFADTGRGRTAYTVTSVVLAILICLIAIFYVFDREAFNRPAEADLSLTGARLPATIIVALVLAWFVIFFGVFFAIE